MSKSRAVTVLRNTVFNYLKEVVEIITFMLITPYIASQLGVEGFGLWSVVIAAVGFFALIDLGFATSVVKFVADARGRGDRDRHRVLVCTFFWVYVGLGVLIMSASLSLASQLPRWINIPAAHMHTARVVFLVLALRSALSLPFSMFLGVLTGHQRLGTVNALRSFGAVFYAVMAFGVLCFSPSLILLAWVNLIGSVVPLVLAMAICLARIEGVTLAPRFFSLRRLREVTSFSLYFFMIQVSMLIYVRVDALIIQAFLSLTAVAVYTLGARVTEKASLFCRQLTNALTPLIAELEGAGEESSIRKVFTTGTKLSVALAVPLLVGLFVLMEDFFLAWMGEAFLPGVPAARLLVGAILVSVVHSNAANVLSMTGHQRFLAFSFSAGQVINLTLTFLLIHLLGIAGVALATLVSSLIIDILVVQRRAGRLHRLPYFTFYREAVWPSVAPCLFMVAAMQLARITWPVQSLVGVVVVEAVGCCVFAAAFWGLGLDSHEKAYYRGKFLGVLDRSKSEKVVRGVKRDGSGETASSDSLTTGSTAPSTRRP